jgi:ubiquinone/menaquinone biosynthesis C-methylase UbiE
MAQPYSGTYFVEDWHKEEDLRRLANQDQLITASLGGALVEQADPGPFRHVLDVACGAGGWAVDVALEYPEIMVVGIDRNPHMIAVAREQAAMRQAAERVEFRMMDALRTLDFPDHSFDLVNLRFALGFMRTWEWSRLLSDLLRILRPGGIIRLTDEKVIHESTSPAMSQFYEILLGALFRSGRLFTQESSGLTGHLASLLNRQGFQKVQAQEYALQYRAGTPQGQIYVQSRLSLLRILRPFIQKWGQVSIDYDALLQQVNTELTRPDFSATWHLVTSWGARSRKLA